MLRKTLNNPLDYKIVGKLKPIRFEKNEWAHNGDIFDDLPYLIRLLSKQAADSNLFINDRKRIKCDKAKFKLIPSSFVRNIWYKTLVRRGRCWLKSSTKIYYNDQIYVLDEYCFDWIWLVQKWLQQDKTIHLFVVSTQKPNNGN